MITPALFRALFVCPLPQFVFHYLTASACVNYEQLFGNTSRNFYFQFAFPYVASWLPTPPPPQIIFFWGGGLTFNKLLYLVS